MFERISEYASEPSFRMLGLVTNLQKEVTSLYFRSVFGEPIQT